MYHFHYGKMVFYSFDVLCVKGEAVVVTIVCKTAESVHQNATSFVCDACEKVENAVCEGAEEPFVHISVPI